MPVPTVNSIIVQRFYSIHVCRYQRRAGKRVDSHRAEMKYAHLATHYQFLNNIVKLKVHIVSYSSFYFIPMHLASLTGQVCSGGDVSVKETIGSVEKMPQQFCHHTSPSIVFIYEKHLVMFITHKGFHWKENKDSSWKQCSQSSVMRESPVPVLNQLNFDSLYQDVCLIPFFKSTTDY